MKKETMLVIDLVNVFVLPDASLEGYETRYTFE